MATLYSPSISTSGLTSCVDVSNPRSYFSGSGTWTNLVPGGANATVSTYSGATQTFYETNPPAIRILQGASNSNNLFSQVFTFSENFTAIIWYKPAATASGIANQTESPGIFQFGAYAQNSSLTIWDWSVNTPNNHKVSTYVNNGSTWSHNVQSTTTYSDAVWCNRYHHIVAAFSGSAGKWNSYKLYVDGTLQSTINFTAPFPSGSIFNSSTFAPAANGGSANNSYSSVYFYNREFNQAEIIDNYNATKGRFGL